MQLWCAGVVCLELELVDGKCESEVPVFFRTIQLPTNLRVVRLVIARPSRNLDLGDMRVLCGVC